MGETTGLALSGGGFRAMLFHLGALWRLNEMAMLAQARCNLFGIRGVRCSRAFLPSAGADSSLRMTWRIISRRK